MCIYVTEFFDDFNTNGYKSKAEIYNAKALQYAETYGVLKYKVDGNKMIWNVSYPAYLEKPRRTVQFKMNLDDGTIYSHRLKRYDPQGIYNKG